MRNALDSRISKRRIIDTACLRRLFLEETSVPVSFRLEMKKALLFLAGLSMWRRDRDLNPRYAINVRRFSRPVLSTTQPSLHYLLLKL